MNHRIIIMMALAVFGAATFAQNPGEPSEASVLDKARQQWASPDLPAVPSESPEATAPAESGVPDGRDASGGRESAATLAIDTLIDVLEELRTETLDMGAMDEAEVGHTPFHLAFTPGLGIPFGLWDVNFSFGSIGDLVRDVDGFQGSGVFNLSRDVNGFQGAGVFNIARDLAGFQGAGVFNILDGNLDGFQAAGVFNIVSGKASGSMSAGVFNIAENAEVPLMAGGVFNIVDGNMDGVQLAGVFNIAGTVRGVQTASIFNAADSVRGLQVGLVNVAGELKGIQLGLVNIALDGVGAVGALYDPASERVDAFIRSGSRALYTILATGAPGGDWFTRADRYFVQAGLGKRIAFGGWLNPYIDFDLSAAIEIGPSLAPARTALECEDWDGFVAAFPDTPWPVARLTIGVPISGRVHALVGYRCDISLDQAPALPEAYAHGKSWSASPFGFGFTAYGSWFFGLSM